MISSHNSQEWLEADGLGGFAMGTVSGIRTRRYHSLLQVATTPPTGRVNLVNGLEAWVDTSEGTWPLSAQRYVPDVVFPNGFDFIRSFDARPWPRWVFEAFKGVRIQHDIFVPHGIPAVVISWKLLSKGNARLRVRPLISGRDYHHSHHANPHFNFTAPRMDSRVLWQPYAGLPVIASVSNATYRHAPEWYRNFIYKDEYERGLDSHEDLASPGEFEWDLKKQEAVLILAAEGVPGASLPDGSSPLDMLSALRRSEESRRSSFPSALHQSADAYVVQRGQGKTIIAGYPWFTDWGRDTFIALRGLCIAGRRLEEAKSILLEWSGQVSDGMMPNVFPDNGSLPDYNSMDASLWYVVAVHDFLVANGPQGGLLSGEEKSRLINAMQKILEGYKKGTRYDIGMDQDGLIKGGQAGVALTWMDARVHGEAVTPRVGKPVEIQALWINALKIVAPFAPEWNALAEKALASFTKRFWNEKHGWLNDVVDVGHVSGSVDASFRPNQIFAVGGLPFPLIKGEKARQLVEQIEAKLLTPLGLRSLSPDEPGYVARYEGDSQGRDRSYHQGIVWPWLMGPFVEAWLNVHGRTVKTCAQARHLFLKPLLDHLDEAGLQHVSEIIDAEPPFNTRGCPFQAWSVAEVLRLREGVLVAPSKKGKAISRSVPSVKKKPAGPQSRSTKKQ